MAYDPKIDHSAERIVSRLKGQLAELDEQLLTLRAQRDAVQCLLSDAETIVADEQRRLKAALGEN
jgi:hypothetical protein